MRPTTASSASRRCDPMARRTPRTEKEGRMKEVAPKNTWGGRRPGAGRKPVGERAGVPHRPRAALGRKLPVHVVLRMADDVRSLRSPKAFSVIEEVIGEAANRFGVRIVYFAVQDKLMHLIVEAATWS